MNSGGECGGQSDFASDEGKGFITAKAHRLGPTKLRIDAHLLDLSL
jgi:hypothetical protein